MVNGFWGSTVLFYIYGQNYKHVQMTRDRKVLMKDKNGRTWQNEYTMDIRMLGSFCFAYDTHLEVQLIPT